MVNAFDSAFWFRYSGYGGNCHMLKGIFHVYIGMVYLSKKLAVCVRLEQYLEKHFWVLLLESSSVASTGLEFGFTVFSSRNLRFLSDD